MVFFSVVSVVLPVLLGVALIRKYREYKWGHCKSKKSLNGQICIVTGANSGIGKEVAKDLASRKAKVILACRDMTSARKAIEDIRKSVSTGELWGHYKSKKSLHGKICIVTGANSGFGKEVAKDLASRNADLASRNAKVILACRDITSARKAIEDIRTVIATGELIPMHVDLASLDSVRKFADEVLRDCPQINILVNNAGLSINEKQETKDGFEIHFGVNHLSHFLLTNLLLKRLQESKPSRVVTVSSMLHEKGKIEFDNLKFEKTGGEIPKGRMNAGYCNSKLANALFSQELAVRAPLESGVSTYAVCPGLTMTGLFRNYKIRFYHYIMFSPIILWHLRTPNQGAQTVIHCAVSEEVEGATGGFYQNCKPYTSKADLNPQLAKELWETSERLVGLKQ